MTTTEKTTLATHYLWEGGRVGGTHGPIPEVTIFIIKPAKPCDSQGGHGPTVTVSHHRTAPSYQVYCL